MSTKARRTRRRRIRRKWRAINTFGRSAGPTHKSRSGRTGHVREKQLLEKSVHQKRQKPRKRLKAKERRRRGG